MNPFISFCLYVAARVFVQYLKSRPKDTQIKASLQFLLSAMHAIKRKNPLTESFLVQLDVDLEGAGLENTSELRAAMPPSQRQYNNKFSSSSGCPASSTQEGNGSSRPPTYGDIGLAAYNDPNAATSIPLTSDAPVKGSTFGAYSVPGLRGQSNGAEAFVASGGQFELQNRQQRSPGSQQSSGISPRPYNPDMDTSPDGSGVGNDRPTPNSSTHSQNNFSSHTSNTTYSPPNMQQQADLTNGGGGMQHTGNLFDQNAATDPNAFTAADFDMHSFPANDNPSSGFIMWDADLNGDLPSGGGTGFTPGPSSGFTPGPIPTMGFTPTNSNNHGNDGAMDNNPSADFMGLSNWSEAEWNAVLSGMDSSTGGVAWETNVVHDAQQEQLTHERLAKRGLLPRNGPFGRG